jgi:HK97 family phage major capsid protein
VGGVSNPSYATLKGRPVKVVEFAETLGTEGDISIVDWSKYQSITKGGVKTDMSMHVRFQYGEMAYRFTYRFDAQPKWDAPLTPYKGSNTTSCFVTLATRS